MQKYSLSSERIAHRVRFLDDLHLYIAICEFKNIYEDKIYAGCLLCFLYHSWTTYPIRLAKVDHIFG